MFARVGAVCQIPWGWPVQTGSCVGAGRPLSEGEWQVFEELNPKEQAHAIRVARKAQGFAAMSSLPTNERNAR